MTAAAPLLLLGAGYLARFVLAALPRAQTVLAVRRRAQALDVRTPQVRPIACDIAAPDAAQRLAPYLEDFCGTVLYLVPPSGLGDAAPAAALAGLAAAIGASAARVVVVASSSGVYAAGAGAVVDASSAVSVHTARARRLVAIEQIWRDCGRPCAIVRLAGLYGPGRIIGYRQVLAGDALPGSGADWLNLVRAEDAACALLAAAHHACVSQPLLISDGTPVRRVDYYTYLARLIGSPLPRFEARRARRGASRRCDPRHSWALLGRAPRYPDYRASLHALLGG